MRKNKKIKAVIFLALFVFLSLSANFVFGQRPLEVQYPEVMGLKPVRETTLVQWIIYLYYFILSIGGLVAFGIFIYGGIKYFTSVGAPAKQAEARSQIFGGILGLIILLSSYLILHTINPQLVQLKAPGAGLISELGLPRKPLFAPKTYVEIPVGTLIENLLDKKAECYQFNSNGDTIGTTIDDRLKCISWLAEAINAKAKKVKDLIDELAELYKCENCCSMAAAGTPACGPGCGMTIETCDTQCKAKCCRFDEPCSAIGCRGSICMDGGSACTATSPNVAGLIASTNEALQALRLKMGLNPLFEEFKNNNLVCCPDDTCPPNPRIPVIDCLIRDLNTKATTTDLLVGYPTPDKSKLKKVLKLKEVFEDIIINHRKELLEDKNAAKILMKFLGLLRNEVAINEIAWMGTATSGPAVNDEWIELYNNTMGDIDLAGWKLKTKSGSLNLNFSIPPAATTTIPAQGFYLLERNSDLVATGTDPDLTGDFVYPNGLLNDGGESLELYDEFGNLVDRVDCSSGWFAGATTAAAVYTMERRDPQMSGSEFGNWATNLTLVMPGEKKAMNGENRYGDPIHGTPKSPNSQVIGVKGPYPSFEKMKEHLKEKLEKKDTQEEIIYIFRKDENLDRLLKSASSTEIIYNILVGTDAKLKNLLGKEEVLRILLEEEVERLFNDPHAKKLFQILLEMNDATFNQLKNQLDEARTNLKLINEFRKDLRWVELAKFLMLGCAEDPASYDQMRGIASVEEVKIELMADWIEKKWRRITVAGEEMFDPALFYCHKLLW